MKEILREYGLSLVYLCAGGIFVKVLIQILEQVS